MPIGLEPEPADIIYVIGNKAIYYDRDNGETVRRGPVPESFQPVVDEKKLMIIESLADVDDIVADVFLM